MVPNALRANYSDLFGSSMLPALEELFRSELESWPQMREKLCKVVKTDRDIWQASEIHDMPLFNEVAEGQDYTFSRPKQGANQTFTIKKYGLGFSISEEAVDDGKFDLIADAVRMMAQSARESQEISAMSLFNSGFSGGSVVTNDGLSLFNNAHTLPSGLTFRNTPASTQVDLSPSTLDQALVDFETQFIGDSGIIKKIQPKILLVHPSNRRYAMEIVGSELKADTPNNNMNSLRQDGLMVVSSPHLTDSDAWFLLSEPAKHGLRIISRKGIETKASDEAVGFINDSIYYKSRYREQVGATVPYGVWGTSGNG